MNRDCETITNMSSLSSVNILDNLNLATEFINDLGMLIDFIAINPKIDVDAIIELNDNVTQREKENKVRVLGKFDRMEVYSDVAIKENQLVIGQILSDGNLLVVLFTFVD